MEKTLENDENSEESITAKHRKERKDLQAKVQTLKKSATKGDKKKRKEILEEIAKLEIDLDKRQAQELNDVNNARTIDELVDDDLQSVPKRHTETETDPPKEQQSQRLSKAQRRREKKAREEKEKEAEIQAQEELNKNGPRMLESRSIKKMLKDRGLEIHSIPSDGDCLYNAVRHQLEMTGRNPYEISYLRNETANYILTNKSNLINYMTNSDTGDNLSDEEFEKYCETLRSSSAWGGQIEIKALSNVLKVPIEVLQATGPPTVQGGEEYQGPNLTITYHRHMYSLGEHYNSTKPLTSDDSQDPDDEG